MRKALSATSQEFTVNLKLIAYTPEPELAILVSKSRQLLGEDEGEREKKKRKEEKSKEREEFVIQ